MKFGDRGSVRTVPGCWQVTARFQDQELRFTAWVAPFVERKHSAEVSSADVSKQAYGQQPTPRLVYIDGPTETKSLVYRVPPEIPPGVDVSGTVVLHAVIGTDGRPHGLQYISGPQQLAQAAIDAVGWWQYRVNAESEEINTTIEVAFPPSAN
jgi:hypothetical protein